MVYAVKEAVQTAFSTGGEFTCVLAGVKLHVNQSDEVLYIEVAEVHERWALRIISEMAEGLGLEVMPEWECPPEELPDGALRHWLAEREEVHGSRGTLQAV